MSLAVKLVGSHHGRELSDQAIRVIPVCRRSLNAATQYW
jgi:hypothetical protein